MFLETLFIITMQRGQQIIKIRDITKRSYFAKSFVCCVLVGNTQGIHFSHRVFPPCKFNNANIIFLKMSGLRNKLTRIVNPSTSLRRKFNFLVSLLLPYSSGSSCHSSVTAITCDFRRLSKLCFGKNKFKLTTQKDLSVRSNQDVPGWGGSKDMTIRCHFKKENREI